MLLLRCILWVLLWLGVYSEKTIPRVATYSRNSASLIVKKIEKLLSIDLDYRHYLIINRRRCLSLDDHCLLQSPNNHWIPMLHSLLRSYKLKYEQPINPRVFAEDQENLAQLENVIRTSATMKVQLPQCEDIRTNYGADAACQTCHRCPETRNIKSDQLVLSVTPLEFVTPTKCNETSNPEFSNANNKRKPDDETSQVTNYYVKICYWNPFLYDSIEVPDDRITMDKKKKTPLVESSSVHNDQYTKEMEEKIIKFSMLGSTEVLADASLFNRAMYLEEELRRPESTPSYDEIQEHIMSLLAKRGLIPDSTSYYRWKFFILLFLLIVVCILLSGAHSYSVKYYKQELERKKSKKKLSKSLNSNKMHYIPLWSTN